MTASVEAPAAALPVGRERAGYTRVEAAGLVLAALAPAMLIGASLLAGLPLGEEGMFAAVIVVAPLLAAGLVWRFGTWAKVLGVVVALALAGMTWWMMFGLGHPAAFADFVPGVLLPVGVLLAIGGGVAAIVARRRGRGEAATARRERRVLTVALVVVVLAAVASAGASVLARTTVDASAATARVTMHDFAFDRGTYRLPAGGTSTVAVHNADPFVHTFTVPELGIDETVLPGSDALVEIDAPAGIYVLYCRPHANLDEPVPARAGMAARIFVVE